MCQPEVMVIGASLGSGRGTGVADWMSIPGGTHEGGPCAGGGSLTLLLGSVPVSTGTGAEPSHTFYEMSPSIVIHRCVLPILF